MIRLAAAAAASLSPALIPQYDKNINYIASTDWQV